MSVLIAILLAEPAVVGTLQTQWGGVQLFEDMEVKDVGWGYKLLKDGTVIGVTSKGKGWAVPREYCDEFYKRYDPVGFALSRGDASEELQRKFESVRRLPGVSFWGCRGYAQEVVLGRIAEVVGQPYGGLMSAHTWVYVAVERAVMTERDTIVFRMADGPIWAFDQKTQRMVKSGVATIPEVWGGDPLSITN